MNTAKSNIEHFGAAIWEGLYYMRVPWLATQSTEEIRRFGVPTTGNKLTDIQMYNNPVTVMITINDMVEYFRKGVSITFVDARQTREVYDIVNNYLMAWRDHLQSASANVEVPIDDLLLLDQFAEKLWPLAQTFGAVKPIFENSLLAALGAGQSNLLSRASFQITLPTQTNEVQRHDNKSEGLVNALANLRKFW